MKNVVKIWSLTVLLIGVIKSEPSKKPDNRLANFDMLLGTRDGRVLKSKSNSADKTVELMKLGDDSITEIARYKNYLFISKRSVTFKIFDNDRSTCTDAHSTGADWLSRINRASPGLSCTRKIRALTLRVF